MKMTSEERELLKRMDAIRILVGISLYSMENRTA